MKRNAFSVLSVAVTSYGEQSGDIKRGKSAAPNPVSTPSKFGKRGALTSGEKVAITRARPNTKSIQENPRGRVLSTRAFRLATQPRHYFSDHNRPIPIDGASILEPFVTERSPIDRERSECRDGDNVNVDSERRQRARWLARLQIRLISFTGREEQQSCYCPFTRIT